MTNKTNIYDTVTNTIIEAIEQGAGRWQMPWTAKAIHLPKNASTGAYYNGINIITLWATSHLKGFGSDEWGTFKQWKALGGAVRKGEKAAHIVFYKEFDVEPADEQDSGKRRVARGYAVFNRDQVDGLEVQEEVSPCETSLVDRIPELEAYIANTRVDIRHGGRSAFYHTGEDYIALPERVSFRDTEHSTATENYYSAVLHELTHWTGAEHRLNRETGIKFGDSLYAFEELVAELGAAFLCARLGITPETRPDHSQYIAHWLQAMKADNKAIFKAAKFAQQAVDLIESLQLTRAAA